MMSIQSYLLSQYLKKRMKRPPIYDEARQVRGMRAAMGNKRLIPKRLPNDVKINDFESNGISGEWVECNQAKAGKVLIYFHSGGYLSGSPQTYRRLTSQIARITRTRVLVVDYRLAPENRFPAAVEDGLKTYRYALGQVKDSQDITIAGDSAGGGLTVATLLTSREAGLPMPKAAICFSPYVDLAATGASLVTNDKNCVMFHGESVRLGTRIYLGDADPRNPLASPIYADLRGLPPLLIFVSTSEIFYDDSIRLAEKAEADGVKVDLNIWKNQPHAWIYFTFLPESKKALKFAAKFIENA